MSPKMNRGIQQDDVWTAADALIAQGLRPTIERVRQHIGRGSPNTVSPMLEAWFATLGPRLGVGESPSGEKLPAPVHKAAVSLWESALAAARDEVVQAFIAEREALAKERAAQAEARTELALRERALGERQEAMDEAVKMAQAQTADLSSRLTEMRLQLKQRDAELDVLRARMEALDKDRESTRHAHDEILRANAEERRRLDERYTATERRWLGELDRARQETRQAKATWTEQERRAQAIRSDLEAEVVRLDAQLHDARAESAALRETLTLAHQHAEELRGMLASRHAADADAFEQLHRRLSERARKTTPARKKLMLRRR